VKGDGKERKRERRIRSARRVDERKRYGRSKRHLISGKEKGHHYVRRFSGFVCSCRAHI
jgi:hypothetical protein